MAFTITTSNGGQSATVVGTNASDAIAAAALANVNTLSLTAFEADDAVFTGATALSGGSSLKPSTLSLGQGDDLVTLGNSITAYGSLVDLGEGADTITIPALSIAATPGAIALAGVSVKGFGGLDTINATDNVITDSFFNGNEGSDRFNLNGLTLNNTNVVGGSEDDFFLIGGGTAGSALNGGRINGQNGDDSITIAGVWAQTGSTIFGGQGNDVMNASGATGRVVFSGDLGNDIITGAVQALDIQGDVLFGGGDNDAVTSLGGADTMTGGEGIDVFNLNVAAAAGAYTSMNVLVDNGVVGVVDSGDVIALNTTANAAGNTFNPRVANITDFGTSDVILTPNRTSATSGNGVAFASPLTGTGDSLGTAGITYKLAGVYNQADGTFTVTNDNLGTDTLLNINGGTQGEFILLKGTSASSLTAANFA